MGENSGVAGKLTEGERAKRRSRGGREEKRLAAEATSCGRRQGVGVTKEVPKRSRYNVDSLQDVMEPRGASFYYELRPRN